jgi:hypothetical protein
MKYPPVENPHLFVEKALESRKSPYQKFSFSATPTEQEPKAISSHPLSAPPVEKKSPTIRPIGAALPNKQFVYIYIVC